MKVLVVNTMAPFVWGGAEELAANLRKNLLAAGHDSELLRIPFRWEPAAHIPGQALMARWLELWNVDRVIALKFPAYLIRHPHKTLWLVHQYRQAYDLYDAGQTNLGDAGLGADVRKMIAAADAEALAECRKVYTISDVVRDRLQQYNDFQGAEVLLPPLNDPEMFTGGASEGYIFAGGRVNAMKRQHLLVEALALAPPAVRLVIAGPPDGDEDRQRLQVLARKLGVEDRLKLDLRFLDRSEYARYVNQSAAVAYLPFNEEYGYVVVEAATAGKPMISAVDSGGVLRLVKDGETGWVCEPDPRALADAMAAAVADPLRAGERGAAARTLCDREGTTWDQVVEKLLS